MPPRFVYWTIIAGGLPTAFRAAEREDLLPTFHRIKERQPDAQMKYFARGKLWESQEDARRDAEERRRAPRPAVRLGRDWRPGGEHRDPRQGFKDAKKDRNLRERKRRFERRTDRPGEPDRSTGSGSPRATSRGDKARPAVLEKPHGDPRRGTPSGERRAPKSFGKPGAPRSFRKSGPPKSFRPSGPPRPRPRGPFKRSR